MYTLGANYFQFIGFGDAEIQYIWQSFCITSETDLINALYQCFLQVDCNINIYFTTIFVPFLFLFCCKNYWERWTSPISSPWHYYFYNTDQSVECLKISLKMMKNQQIFFSNLKLILRHPATKESVCQCKQKIP